MAVKPKRLYVPLDVKAQRNARIRQANREARSIEPELLYYRGLMHCKAHRNDSIIDVFDGPSLGSGMKKWERIAAALVAVELWEEHEDGWSIVGWFEWNASNDEIDKLAEQKRLGAARTNHKLGRHAEQPDPECPDCEGRSSDRSSDAGPNALATAPVDAPPNAKGRGRLRGSSLSSHLGLIDGVNSNSNRPVGDARERDDLDLERIS